MKNWLRAKLRAWLLADLEDAIVLQKVEILAHRTRTDFLEETVKSLEISVNSLIDAKAAPEEKKEDEPTRTPRPKTWHERRDAYIASRSDKGFIEKLIASKDKQNAPKDVGTAQ